MEPVAESSSMADRPDMPSSWQKGLRSPLTFGLVGCGAFGALLQLHPIAQQRRRGMQAKPERGEQQVLQRREANIKRGQRDTADDIIELVKGKPALAGAISSWRLKKLRAASPPRAPSEASRPSSQGLIVV